MLHISPLLVHAFLSILSVLLGLALPGVLFVDSSQEAPPREEREFDLHPSHHPHRRITFEDAIHPTVGSNQQPCADGRGDDHGAGLWKKM